MQTLLTPAWHQPEDGPAGRYMLRGLSGIEILTMQGMVAEANGNEWKLAALAGQGELPPAAVLYVLGACVSDWEGLAEGAIVGGSGTFDKDRLPGLCQQHMNSCVMEILARSILLEDTEKNSSSQSKSPPTARNSTALDAGTADIAAS